MSSPSIARAIDLAKRAEHCRQTGQPRMAALYEKNLRQTLHQVKQDIRTARIQANPFRAFQYLGEDLADAGGPIWDAALAAMNEIFGAVATAQNIRQSDVAKVA